MPQPTLTGPMSCVFIEMCDTKSEVKVCQGCVSYCFGTELHKTLNGELFRNKMLDKQS